MEKPLGGNAIIILFNQNPMLRLKKWLKTELPSLLLLILGVMAFRSSVADHYYVPSGSMEYTLLSGDRVVVDKSAYGLRVPFTAVEVIGRGSVARGDVVIFDSPRDGTRLIKRIVGVGGDSISILGGRLTVNGNPAAFGVGAAEAYGEKIVGLNLSNGGGPDIASMPIPPGMLLAVGDHRGNSLDGRFFGLIRASDVYGKAVGVYRRRGEGFVWRPL
ncbi:MAG: signal peptidase I [Woeseiaceae bacterium]